MLPCDFSQSRKSSFVHLVAEHIDAREQHLGDNRVVERDAEFHQLFRSFLILFKSLIAKSTLRAKPMNESDESLAAASFNVLK